MTKDLFPKILIITFILFGCESNDADLIIENGTIYTMNDLNPIIEAVAVKNGKIIGLGSKNHIKSFESKNTKTLDLKGYTMTPGLIEGHGHFMGLGYSKMRLDLSTVANYNELVDMVADAVSNAKPGEWILGRGWHQSKWDTKPLDLVKGFQTHNKLSQVSPDNPVWLKHASGHAAFGNAKAMEIAGITSETEFGFGGEIIKDLKGNPTGIFNERAQGLVSRYVEEEGNGDAQRALQLAVKTCLENGITSFQDAGSGTDAINNIREGLSKGELKVRLYVMLTSRDPELLKAWYKKGPEIGTGNDYLTIRSIKLNADGALGSRGAWLLDDYRDRPGHFGMATQSMEYVYEVS